MVLWSRPRPGLAETYVLLAEPGGANSKSTSSSLLRNASSAVMAEDQPTPGTSPGTEKMPATQGELMKSVPSDALPISEYYKAAVYDPKDAKIGDVEDVLLDRNGKVDAVMLGVGGFLGIGEKDVAVPFNAIKVTEKNGKRYLVMDTTKQALESAPGYTYDRTKGVWIPATKA
jgi:sporulation protein YlmC with PRC-barrel domain